MAQAGETRHPTIAVLGTGKMGEALLRGLSRHGSSWNLIATDIIEGRVSVAKKLGIEATMDNREAVKRADVIVIAVKPNQVAPLLAEVGRFMTEKQLVVSIAAGIALSYLRRYIPQARLIRTMPNINAAVNEAITAIAPDKSATKEDIELAREIFGSTGVSAVVDEELLDVITGLSGSGPAYFFTIARALADGGAKMGLNPELALKFTVHVMLGSAKSILETGRDPLELAAMVTTPSGTTAAGLRELEKAGYRQVFENVVRAATERAREIRKEMEEAAP